MRSLVGSSGLAFALGVALLTLPGSARALPSFSGVGDIPLPNGATGGCGICHVASGGGGARNAFGTAWDANGQSWTRGLADNDSDGDGWSNGQELGDPFGQWTSGSALGVYRSLPGDGGDEPTDFNLCTVSSMNDCATNSTCSSSSGNGLGDWSCTCNSGYTGPGERRVTDSTTIITPPYTIRSTALTNGQACANFDACSGPDPCGNGTCVDEAPPSTTYRCNCDLGYRDNGTTCVDINECAGITPPDCGTGTCSNLVPGYTCNCPATSVRLGTWPSTVTCVDGCDAAAGADCVTSPVVAACTPQAGTPPFMCTCPEGYDGNGRAAGTGCSNTNECATGDVCGVATSPTRAASCNDLTPHLDGGDFYSCTCLDGFRFELDPLSMTDTCVNIDECAELSPCDDDGDTAATCADLPGSYSCGCSAGFVFDGTTCFDIEECATAPCGSTDAVPRGTCAELPAPPGGYSCTCTGSPAAPLMGSGFECQAGNCDNSTCVDIDECMDSVLNVCSLNATCTNQPGSFDCTCIEGYEGDGLNCVDIDECARGLDNCADDIATCTNTEGRFFCTCNDGYRGSGVTCQDIDECLESLDACGANETCFNEQGADPTCRCAPGFVGPNGDDVPPCFTDCGDGLRIQNEACDDGNEVDGDGCSALCAVESGWACTEDVAGLSTCVETCGNGQLDLGEECDDGDAVNSDTMPNACRTTCELPSCGDGVIDAGDACDDGDANSDTAVDGCRTTCDTAYCGDGVVDTGEQCDPGGGVPNASVVGTCTTLCPPVGGPDMGVDPNDPPALVGGGGCAVGGRGSSGAGWLLLMLCVFGWLRRRR